MADNRPKQSLDYKKDDISTLTKQIKTDLKKLGMTQKELATLSDFPESRISRILRGGKVKVPGQDVAQLAVGLRKSLDV